MSLVQLSLFDLPSVAAPRRDAITLFAVLPVQPLAEAIRLRATCLADDYQHPLGLNRLLGPMLERSYHRARCRGRISPELADRICVRGLHQHPSQVWGPLWFEVAPEWDDDRTADQVSLWALEAA